MRSLRFVKQLDLKVGESTDLESLGRLLISLEYTRLEAVALKFEVEADYKQTLDYHDFPVYLPRTIRRMSLTSVALPLESIIKLDSWPNLIDMELNWCENVVSMLANFSSLKLVSFGFAVTQGPCNLEETESYAISSMLSRFQCLQHLRIAILWFGADSRLRYKAVGRMAKSIVCHSAHLKSLVYQENPIKDQPDKITNAITAAAKQCVNLEELAIWGVKPSAIVRVCKVRHLQPSTMLRVLD